MGRVKLVGWEKGFLKVLSVADAIVDTFPSGGGVTIVDAMALGIPGVSFKNNHMQNYTQTDWSPAEEFMGVPELHVERDNMDQLRLLTDQAYRLMLSELCEKAIHRTSGSPEEMVRSCEQASLKVIRDKCAGKTSDGNVSSFATEGRLVSQSPASRAMTDNGNPVKETVQGAHAMTANDLVQNISTMRTESYLLQAFLSFNNEFEILFSMTAISAQRAGVFRAAFPHHDPSRHLLNSGSIWLRRKK